MRTVDAVLPAHPLGVPLHRLLHPQRRIARPHRVVLVGEGRAEQRHDPVAHHLVDGALVPMHRLHHVLEHGVEELARLLGIAVGEQLHRALQVGEEDRDLLALALQGGLGGEDLLGEVLGGVAIGRARRSRRTAQRLTAAVTEAARGWIHLPARGADRLQPTATPIAESRAGGVLLRALGAEHQAATARTKRSTSASSL